MDENSGAVISRFLVLLGGVAADLLGPKELTTLVPELHVRKGLSRFFKGSIESTLSPADEPLIENRVARIISQLEKTFGDKITENWLEDIYTKIERQFSPAEANEYILSLIDERYLEKYRLRLLSQEELATMLEHERRRDRELAHANAELRAMDVRKSEFITTVSHQLRTPLTGIRWSLELVIKGDVGEITPEQRSVLEKGYLESSHMMSLVEDMLHAEKIEAGRFTLVPNATNLVDVLTAVISVLTPLSSQKNVSIKLESHEELPTMLLDPDKIAELFQNLIENAIKYSPSGKEILVQVIKKEKTVEVSVADHGIGIPKEEESEIFSRFYRATNARRVSPDGNGIGLYVAKHIATLHGGDIRFESVVDQGTTFTVTLPLE